MPEPVDIYGTAFKNGSATLLARVVGADGTPVTTSDLSAIRYSVYLLDDQDPDSRTPVTGHTGTAVPVADDVLDALQQDALWTVDTVGYNFRHVLDVSAAPAFSNAGRRYLVEFQLTPRAGQMILVRFRINVI